MPTETEVKVIDDKIKDIYQRILELESLGKIYYGAVDNDFEKIEEEDYKNGMGIFLEQITILKDSTYNFIDYLQSLDFF